MKKRGQVWIETVIYTLIAFALIGAVLGFAKPKIEEIQDKAIIEQTTQMMEDINSQIETVKEVQGNKRLIELGIKKGNLIIDGRVDEDNLFFVLEGRHTYTEPGVEVPIGSLSVSTIERGKINTVTLKSNYGDSYDIQFDEQDIEKIINPASVPHKLFIENMGRDFYVDETVTDCANPEHDCINSDYGGWSRTCISGKSSSEFFCKYISKKIKLDFSLG